MSSDLPPLTDDAMRAYLDRVGLDESPAPDLEGITALHRAHLYAIPFENLDIHLGDRIHLEADHLFDKLVTRRRGGFCYEQNALFARVLTHLGVEVTLLSSRVASGPRGWGPPFDHMTLCITLDRAYLLDVGFGDSYRDPLPLEEWHLDSSGVTYRAHHRDDGIVVQHLADDPRLGRMYLTDPTPRRLEEFGPMCHFQQTSPKVWFTQSWVVTLPLQDGRMTAAPGSFTRTRGGIKQRRDVVERSDLEGLLRDEFGMTGIELPAGFPVQDAPASPQP